MDMSDQLDAVNPTPVAGGDNVWFPPSKQVRYADYSAFFVLFLFWR